MTWWRCPNEPPCPHGAVLHDIEDAEDQLPRCCAEGCGCGAVATDDDRLYAEDVYQVEHARTLAEALAELEATNPEVAAAKAKLDEFITSPASPPA
jgi:hypothetical protein